MSGGIATGFCEQGAVPPLPTAMVGTRLITDAREREQLSLNRETDCRTALTRGLAEYLSQQSIDFADGRQLALKNVLSSWAESEDTATYPAALVSSVGTGEYDMSRFVPGAPIAAAFPNGQRLITGAEFAIDMTVDLWANDPPARSGLVAMIEDALVPVDWRYGALLELPHYFNVRGTFELINSTYIDGDLPGMQRYRRATITVRGRVAQMRVLRYVRAALKTRTEILASSEPLT